MALTELTSDTFDSAISEGVVLVDFWAPWCAPCRAMTPLLEQVATDIGDSAKITKVNTQDEPDLASKFQITSIPAVILFKNGEQVDSFIGLKPKPAIKEFIEKHI